MTDEFWIVEWTYSPADYFEEPLQIFEEGYELIAQDGKVEVKVDHDPRPELCDQMDTELRLRFQGVQLVSHEQYELSQPSVSCRRPNGTRTFFCEGTIAATATVSTDFKITDKDGNVIEDSRAKRIQRKRSLGALAAKYGGSNTVAGKILQSYNKAMNNSDNCFVHLYEIREALAKHFGRDKNDRNKLKVTKARWQELGRLANDAPLKQGRHRGKMLSELRDATRDELNATMNIAAEMVEKYLKYLDEGQT